MLKSRSRHSRTNSVAHTKRLDDTVMSIIAAGIVIGMELIHSPFAKSRRCIILDLAARMLVAAVTIHCFLIIYA
jgi:hypothetical protein